MCWTTRNYRHVLKWSCWWNSYCPGKLGTEASLANPKRWHWNSFLSFVETSNVEGRTCQGFWYCCDIKVPITRADRPIAELCYVEIYFFMVCHQCVWHFLWTNTINNCIQDGMLFEICQNKNLLWNVEKNLPEMCTKTIIKPCLLLYSILSWESCNNICPCCWCYTHTQKMRLTHSFILKFPNNILFYFSEYEWSATGLLI